MGARPTSTTWWLLALGALLLGCRSPTSRALDGGHADAAATVAASASDAAAAPRAAAIVDLLLETDARITVSSRVDNARDFPDHLVDGRPETAWNSKTGDLRGRIEVELPEASHVESIAITAGFDKKKGTDDLFVQNHRIKRIRITRDGAMLREAALEIERRDLQHVRVDAPGGKFRIEVLETAS